MSLWAGQVAGLITDLAGQDMPVGEAVERLAAVIAAGIGCYADEVGVDVRWLREPAKPLRYVLSLKVEGVELVTNGDTCGVFPGGAEFDVGPVGGLVPLLDRFAAEARAAQK